MDSNKTVSKKLIIFLIAALSISFFNAAENHCETPGMEDVALNYVATYLIAEPFGFDPNTQELVAMRDSEWQRKIDYFYKDANKKIAAYRVELRFREKDLKTDESLLPGTISFWLVGVDIDSGQSFGIFWFPGRQEEELNRWAKFASPKMLENHPVSVAYYFADSLNREVVWDYLDVLEGFLKTLNESRAPRKKREKVLRQWQKTHRAKIANLVREPKVTGKKNGQTQVRAFIFMRSCIQKAEFTFTENGILMSTKEVYCWEKPRP